MKKYCMILILTLLLVAAGVTAQDPPTAQEAVEVWDLENPAILETFVAAVVQTHMKEQNSPSGVVSVVKDGRLIFARGYGYQDLEARTAVDPERTLFRPGSISKLFTWTAVMQQVEQGTIDLDADVNIYLKEFKIRDNWPGQPVTMRHVMTHSAGFEDGGLGYLFVSDVSRFMPLHESLSRFQPERVNPPGAQTAYSNYATAMAGLIVSNVSGLSFNEYIEQHIFQPLAMNNSSFREPLPAALVDNMATAYSYASGAYKPEPFELISNFAPAGALSATATDMGRFMLAFLNGGELDGNRILQEATVREMLTRQFSHDERLSGMALGFYENELNGVRLLGHGGDTIYFHSNLGLDLESNVGFFVSFGGAGGANVRTTFTEAFADRFYPQAEDNLMPPSDFAQRAGEYAGTYMFWRGNFSTLEKLMSLAGGMKVAPTEEGTLLIGERQFVEVGPDLFQVTGEPGFLNSKIAFQRNDRGEVSGFIMENLPFMSTYKAPFYKGLSFNGLMLGLAYLAFVAVLLRRAYQRKAYKALPKAEKRASRAAVVTALLNLLFIVAAVVFVMAYGMDLFFELPATINLVLLLPLLATLAAVYQLYQAVLLWRGGLCNIWQRLRYSCLTLMALYMAWFYNFSNLLGFQYMS